jgi:glycosyltransferase involved in cell wall biosynthesis
LKIALDSWVLAGRFRHQGTRVYAEHLFGEFRCLAEAERDVSFCLFTAPDSGNEAEAIGAGTGFELKPERMLGHDRLWRLGAAGRAAARSDADVLFAPVPALMPMGRVPVACTIHDVTPLTAPSHSRPVVWQQRYFLRTAARRSRKIIAVSEHSKADLVNLLGLPEEKIRVVYNGVDRAVFNDRPAKEEKRQRVLSKIGVEKPYIFHHGTIQPRKNLARLVQAYRLLLAKNRNLDFDLVLAGALGWQYEEVVRLAKANGAGRVILTGALEDQEIAMLLRGASLVVIPSLYEGFCLPMVEAMACGAPVIAARTSCLPEISGGVLRYFDPLSMEDMAACMEQVLDNADAQNQLRERGRQQAARFDWLRCAAETLAVLRQAAHS